MKTQSSQLELFPKPKTFDINKLIEALIANGDKLERLSVLLDEVRANPRKQRYSQYRVKNPDGSVYRRKRNRT